MLVQQIPTLLPALAVPHAVVLWVQTGCGHCHDFFEWGFKPVVQKTQQAVQTGEAPPIRFFVLDGAAGGFAQEAADAEGIEATPTLTAYKDGTRVGKLEGPKGQREFGEWLVKSFAD